MCIKINQPAGDDPDTRDLELAATADHDEPQHDAGPVEDASQA